MGKEETLKQLGDSVREVGWGGVTTGPMPPGWDGDIGDQEPEEPAEVLRG